MLLYLGVLLVWHAVFDLFQLGQELTVFGWFLKSFLHVLVLTLFVSTLLFLRIVVIEELIFIWLRILLLLELVFRQIIIKTGLTLHNLIHVVLMLQVHDNHLLSERFQNTLLFTDLSFYAGLLILEPVDTLAYIGYTSLFEILYATECSRKCFGLYRETFT